MARTVHFRLYNLRSKDHDQLYRVLRKLAESRQWRSEAPWLADAKSTDFFKMEFFSHLQNEGPAIKNPLAAAGFTKIQGDESDALAVLFLMRDLSDRFGLNIIISDPDNPIAKLRSVELSQGLLDNGDALESILVARPIYKRLPGATIELYPPQALNFAYGHKPDHPKLRNEERQWSFSIHGMRGSAPSFFEAEAEAMRIYNGLRFTNN